MLRKNGIRKGDEKRETDVTGEQTDKLLTQFVFLPSNEKKPGVDSVFSSARREEEKGKHDSGSSEHNLTNSTAEPS